MTRTLALLRHAKSGYPDGVADHERPLAQRGRREAVLAGRLLGERLTAVDVALVSTARRAQETWAAVAPSLRVGSRADLDDLYLASADELLAVVRRQSPEHGAVLLVGHNDGLEELAGLLSGTHVTLKTSTFALLSSPRGWAEWSAGSAELDDVVVAR
jgi:phosphohistidine phosphatase